MTIKTTLSIAAAKIGIQTAHANNVVVDMSQVQDYNQYQWTCSNVRTLLCRISRTRLSVKRPVAPRPTARLHGGSNR